MRAPATRPRFAPTLAAALALGCSSAPSPDIADGESSDGDTGTPADSSRGEPPGSTASTAPDDSTGTDDPSASTGPGEDDSTTGAPAEGTPIFVLAGQVGRTAISCDRGLTWIADQSQDPSLRCGDGLDCDHHPGNTTGLAFGDGAFVATLGWGTEGTIRRSVDGVAWETVATGPTFAGVVFGGGVFVAGNREAWRSEDLGLHWDGPVTTGLIPFNGRGVGFGPVADGTFVISGGGDAGAESDIVASNDAGATWWHPDAIAAGCGDGVLDIVGNGETLLVVRYGGPDGPEFCVSQDQGHVWSSVDLGDVWLESRALWTGREYIAWGGGLAFTSVDGQRWTSTPVSPEVHPGAVAIDDVGTFVAVEGGWQSSYEDQEFYRSADGRTWEVLAPGAFTGGHPVGHLAFGHVADGGACG